MIRIFGYPIGKIYFNEYEIKKVYTGEYLVFPDLSLESNFWLKVTMANSSVVYCWCRQTAKIEDEGGNITDIRYVVIQSQDEEPEEEYYELTLLIYVDLNTSGIDYTDQWDVMDKTPDQVYELIPQINQKIIAEMEQVVLYLKGIRFQNFSQIDLGIKVTDYDKFVLTISNVTYTGEAIFGTTETVDGNDFRFFGAGSNLYFDVGPGRINNSFSRSKAANIFTVYLNSGGRCYVEQDLNNSGTPTVTNLGTSRAFSSYTSAKKELYFGPRVSQESFVFYELKCYSGDTLLNDFVIHPDDLSLSSVNRIYDKVNNTFIELPQYYDLYSNPYPYIRELIRYIEGNELNDFYLLSSSSTITKEKNNERCRFTYKKVLVNDSINTVVYDTSAVYVSDYIYYTPDPSIYYDSVTYRLQAYGSGTLYLYVNNTEVSNPYTFVQNASTMSYSVSAIAQESGKLLSRTISSSVTIEGYQTDPPTILFDNFSGNVSVSGNGTLILYINNVIVTNPYTLTEYGIYTVSATAQESGKVISETVTKLIEYSEQHISAFINYRKIPELYGMITNVILDNTTVLTCRYYRTKLGSLFGCSDNTGGSWENSVKSSVYRNNYLYFGGAKKQYETSLNETHTIVVSYKDQTIEIDGTVVATNLILSNNTCLKYGLCCFYHEGKTLIDGGTSNGQYINYFEYKHGDDVYLINVDDNGLVSHSLNGNIQSQYQTTVDIFA